MELQDKIETIIQIDARSSGLLSDWDRGFLESVYKQTARKSALSPKQQEMLSKIEEKCSEDAVDSHEEWVQGWDKQKKKIATICAQYYMDGGMYFLRLANRVLFDPDFIPSEKAFKKMCSNKYAKKILVAALEDPKYPAGTTVSFRSSYYNSKNALLKYTPGLVIEAGGKLRVVSPVKGGKPYLVLPFGAKEMVRCEERHLMLYRKKKKK
jgi:hypothetical protein